MPQTRRLLTALPGTAIPGTALLGTALLGAVLLAACGGEAPPATQGASAGAKMVASGTCQAIYPSYWQDPAPQFSPQWVGQEISNVPPPEWDGPVFRLSDFDPSTDQATKTALAEEYAWAVMRYIQEGNIGSGDVETDWTLCDNPVRPWFHIPYQTYEVLSGREFVHGLTREAPVSFSLQGAQGANGSDVLASTMWAVGFFNATAGYTLGTVWEEDGTAAVPDDDISFDEGAVVGKLLFNTLGPDQLPVLRNMPAWTASISDPTFCTCTPPAGESKCSMPEESRQCARTLAWQGLHLLQFDMAIKESRAPGTEWVFATFVADGIFKADKPEPWNRISPLGVMWGNDTPPPGTAARDHPADPRGEGFMEEVIFWDVVDRLNAVGGSQVAMRPGHLGCNQRLNGPADNANSSCMSCHGTASVPDADDTTPILVAQFDPANTTAECVLPSSPGDTVGTDATGATRTVKRGVPFSATDQIFFANTPAATPVDMTAETPDGPVNIMGEHPVGRSAWISLDYSLQLAISLVQWEEWQETQRERADSIHDALMPRRGRP